MNEPEEQPNNGAAHLGVPRRFRLHTYHEGDQPDEVAGREKWLYRIRAFPHQRFPRGARMRAFEQVRRMRFLIETGASSSSDSALHWTLVGPQPTFDGYAGRVTSIAIDPKNQNTIYIGGAEGGVWKSTDGGVTWKPLTDFEPALAIGSLAIDPSNSSVIYAGTGEQNFNADAYAGVGILKTTDGGSTWTVLGGDVFDQQAIGSLAIEPRRTRPQISLKPLYPPAEAVPRFVLIYCKLYKALYGWLHVKLPRCSSPDHRRRFFFSGPRRSRQLHELRRLYVCNNPVYHLKRC